MAVDDWDDPTYNVKFVQEYGLTINNPGTKEADQGFTPDAFDDSYLNMELTLPREGSDVPLDRIVKRLRDEDGLPIGAANNCPILDSSRVYEVEFQDGYRASLAANAIEENLFAQLMAKAIATYCFRE